MTYGPPSVGLPEHRIPCRSCRRLRSFDLVFFKTTEDQDQKIAAFGSSYGGYLLLIMEPFKRCRRPLPCYGTRIRG
ncbi:hypothetical protein CUN63_08155 [Pseudomonas sp. ACM7]|nr:hypothetical protein CUN63_08155 [Pseudomonas sp. ACM7]